MPQWRSCKFTAVSPAPVKLVATFTSVQLLSAATTACAGVSCAGKHVTRSAIARAAAPEGDCAKAQALEDVEVRDPEAGRAYEVERILAHRGKPGTAQHMFLVKWKGYLPEKSTWVRADDINADAAIAEYADEVKARLDYWQGIAGPLASDKPA